MTDPLLSMVDMLALLDLDPYIAMPRSRETFARLKQLRTQATAQDNAALLTAVEDRAQEEIVRTFAAGSIAPGKTTIEQVGRLGKVLQETQSVSLRLAVVRTLSKIPTREAVGLLFKSLVRAHDPDLRGAIAYAIRVSAAQVIWQEKVRLLLDELEADGRYREHLEMSTLVTAISPSDEDLRQNRFILTDHLIGHAPGRDERMIGILAGLSLQSCGGNINRANERIEVYAKAQDEDRKTWQALRAEINSLLTPAELRANLEETFQKPLTAVHREIQSTWQTAVKDTGRILKMRLAIGVLIVFVGIGLLAFSIWRGFWYQEWSTGLSVGAVALIALIFSFFYSGPIRETRRTLADIGVANAVYAAYVQRMLEISHIFTRFYLDERKPSYEDVEKSNKLINQVVQDTVKALREDRPTTLDDLIDQYS